MPLTYVKSSKPSLSVAYGYEGAFKLRCHLEGRSYLFRNVEKSTFCPGYVKWGVHCTLNDANYLRENFYTAQIATRIFQNIYSKIVAVPKLFDFVAGALKAVKRKNVLH